MKKIIKSFLLAALSCAVLAGCQDLTKEQNEQFEKLVESEEGDVTGSKSGTSDVYYPPLLVITTEPEILDDANFDVKLDLLEEKSGHWINHVVSSGLPGAVANAIQSGEIDLILGAWENKWVEYKTSDFWRDDWQLVKFAAETHYLPYFNEVVDKTGKVHDFSDCLSEGTYYLKAEYNNLVYKGYFELALPYIAKEYIESVTFNGITIDSSNLAQFPVLLEESLDKTSKENKVVIGGALTTEQFKQISVYLRNNDKYISEIDLSKLNLEETHSSGSGAAAGGAFYECKNLKKIVLPSNLKILGEGTFSKCTSLETVVLPATLEEINWSVFYYCSKLKTITIPASVRIIQQTVFSNCSSLEEVIFEEGSHLERLGYLSFELCNSLKSIVIPPSVTDLTPITSRSSFSPNCIFRNCSNLTTVTFNNSVIKIKSTEFTSCPNLSTINFYGTEEEWNAIEGKSSNLDSIVNFIED